jgi:hypothetical protein
MSNASNFVAKYHEKYFEQMSNKRIARKRRKITCWRCKKIIFFSFFSRKIFLDFNENAKRQRGDCDVYAKRIIYIFDYLIRTQNQSHDIIKIKID